MSKKQRIDKVLSNLGYGSRSELKKICKNGLVKVNGNYSKVIGRICMDQCVIDVTDVKEIKTGDVVYIIDCDDINLSSEKFAMNADTITNEFLSRLGNRLPRIRS